MRKPEKNSVLDQFHQRITTIIFVITIRSIVEIDITTLQVGSPESEEDGEHFNSRPIDFTTGRRMSDDSSEGEEEYFR